MKKFNEMKDNVAKWRALQIWLVLIGCAHNQQLIQYGQLASIMGYGGAGGIGHELVPILEYCDREGLPPLTAIAVNKESGLPGSGFSHKYNTTGAAQMAVFEFNWYDIVPPTADDF